MRTLFTVNLDGDFGADRGTEGTARAGLAGPEGDRVISPRIEFLRGADQHSLARPYTEVALLAEFPVDGDVGLHEKNASLIGGVNAMTRIKARMAKKVKHILGFDDTENPFLRSVPFLDLFQPAGVN
jgi:hypothetical protein